MTSTDEEFAAYDAKNPVIYEMFKRFALEKLTKGGRRVSGETILHRIRWETDVAAEGDTFKVNQRWSSRYSRKFVDEYPEYRDAFAFRGLRT